MLLEFQMSKWEGKYAENSPMCPLSETLDHLSLPSLPLHLARLQRPTGLPLSDTY